MTRLFFSPSAASRRNSREQSVPKLAGELLRYLFVGGVAFLVDFFAFLFCVEYFVPEKSGAGLYLAAVVSFIAGFTVNYCLSFLLVFTGARYGKRRASVFSFLVFAAIALVGLGLTELGIFAGVSLFNCDYRVVKIVVSLIVLAWNYGIRRIFLLRRQERPHEA
jgi:putative flippase GtrA